jgi:DNA-binding NtrC family response regulator
MDARRLRALLVGEYPEDSSNLAKRLQERGFQCEFASSSEQALSLAGTYDFELVLSPVRLHGASLLSLMDLFAESAVTLFYFHGVEEGCWWLPAIRHGKRCFGSSAFRPGEFASALDAAIEEATHPALMAHNSETYV